MDRSASAPSIYHRIIIRTFDRWHRFQSLLLLLISHFLQVTRCQTPLVTDNYYGTPLGSLIPGNPASGSVYIVDDHTLFIKGFSFPGTRFPFSYFQSGPSFGPDGTGFTLADENGSFSPLGDYSQKDLVLKLPDGRNIRDSRWFSIWSQNDHRSLGHVLIPLDVRPPKPLDLPPLTTFAHDVRSGPIKIVDAQTILIPNFWYDGLGPAAYWWVTRGPRQSPQGLRLKDENGSVRPLRAYHGETVLLSLPDTKTIYDFDWLGVWCEEFQVDFGSVHIPQHIRVPPSPAMLGLKPEAKLNCEVFDDSRGFEMRWILDQDDIVIQLVGKMLPNEYMAVGLGRDDQRSLMINADAMVAWVDAQGQGHVQDYYLSAKEPCVGARGACPDLRYPGATDSTTLLHAAVINGFRMVTFKRPQLGVDEQYDQHVYSDGQQSVIWSYGPLNHLNEVSYHINHQYGDRFIDFARQPLWNCPRPDQALMNQRKWQQLIASSSSSINVTTANDHPNDNNQTIRETRSPDQASIAQATPTTTKDVYTTIATVSSITPPTISSTTNSPPSTVPPPVETESNSIQPWIIPKIVCPQDKTLYAQMGPVGGRRRGYEAITGRQGWGKAWYINGLLIPELVLKRGETYTFWVEGGNDSQNNARRHPLYLTTSAEGGFDHKTQEERRRERVFAGVGITKNGTILPTAEGRNCEWRVTSQTNINDVDGTYETFEDFRKTLRLECDQNGQPGMLRFTPDSKTPDLLYYQCYNHRYMGWKIHVVDRCPNQEEQPQPQQQQKSQTQASGSGSQRLQSADSIVQTEFLSPMILQSIQQPQQLPQSSPQSSSSSSSMMLMDPMLTMDLGYTKPKFQPRPTMIEYPIHTTSNDQPPPIISPSGQLSSTYFFKSLQNFGYFDPFMDQMIIPNGLQIPQQPQPQPVPSSINPYTPSMTIIHQEPFGAVNGRENLMMKKYGVRFPTTAIHSSSLTMPTINQADLHPDHLHHHHQHQHLPPSHHYHHQISSGPKSTVIRSQAINQPMVLKKSQASLVLKPQTTFRRLVSKPPPTPSTPAVQIQSGGFVPIMSAHNKYTHSRPSWLTSSSSSSSSTLASKQMISGRNKFNEQPIDDILRIRPMDSPGNVITTKITGKIPVVARSPSLSSTATASASVSESSITAQPITPTTTTTTTTQSPPTTASSTVAKQILLADNSHSSDRKALTVFEYSNGLLSDEDATDQDDESKILQTSASALVPRVTSIHHQRNATTDHIILSDVMRLIAHNLEQQQSQQQQQHQAAAVVSLRPRIRTWP